MFKHLVVASVLWVGARASAAPCVPDGRWSELVARPGVLVVGAEAGQEEAPELVGELACLAASKGHVTTVALDIDAEEQARIDDFLSSPGTRRDREDLLTSPFWQAPFQDGRQSTAVLRLLDEIRAWRAAGLPIEATATVGGISGEDADERYLEGLFRVASTARAGSLTIGLTRSERARVDVKWSTVSRLRSMGIRATGVETAYATGTAWNCDGACGVHQVWGHDRGATAFVRILTEDESPYDALVYLGKMTASPPGFVVEKQSLIAKDVARNSE